ncbi:MAG: hypothetical protein AAF907_09445 [Planctomycetota bacterium]
MDSDPPSRGLITLWAALAGGWLGTFTPVAAFAIYHKLTIHPGVAATNAQLGYDIWFELELLGCAGIATGVVGGPIGLAGSYAATLMWSWRSAGRSKLRTALFGAYTAGLTIGSLIAGGLFLR